MNSLFRVMGISRQGFHQYMDRQMRLMEEQQQFLPVISQLRDDHPRMSAREMYRLIQPRHLGRDRFIRFCFENGYKVELKRSFHRTTNSLGVIRFPNLVAGRELTGVNQVWVSDITYYRMGDQFYYQTFITDLYSRRIVGFSVSDNMMTEETTLPALQLALMERKPPPGLIFHSDGGGQYYSKVFRALTMSKGIKNSMCESVYENAHAERINGTIKNDYVIPYSPTNFNQLKRMTKKAVNMYNIYRPHQALKGMSPVSFEENINRYKPLKTVNAI